MLFYFLAVIPLGFLIYTLVNLKKLGIPIYHPRVIVELAIVIILVLIGILFY